MILRLFCSKNSAVILKTATWLAANRQKEAATLLVKEVMRREPQNKACRSTYARIMHRDPDLLKKELEKEGGNKGQQSSPFFKK